MSKIFFFKKLTKERVPHAVSKEAFPIKSVFCQAILWTHQEISATHLPWVHGDLLISSLHFQVNILKWSSLLESSASNLIELLRIRMGEQDKQVIPIALRFSLKPGKAQSQFLGQCFWHMYSSTEMSRKDPKSQALFREFPFLGLNRTATIWLWAQCKMKHGESGLFSLFPI